MAVSPIRTGYRDMSHQRDADRPLSKAEIAYVKDIAKQARIRRERKQTEASSLRKPMGKTPPLSKAARAYIASITKEARIRRERRKSELVLGSYMQPRSKTLQEQLAKEGEVLLNKERRRTGCIKETTFRTTKQQPVRQPTLSATKFALSLRQYKDPQAADADKAKQAPQAANTTDADSRSSGSGEAVYSPPSSPEPAPLTAEERQAYTLALRQLEEFVAVIRHTQITNSPLFKEVLLAEHPVEALKLSIMDTTSRHTQEATRLRDEELPRHRTDYDINDKANQRITTLKITVLKIIGTPKQEKLSSPSEDFKKARREFLQLVRQAQKDPLQLPKMPATEEVPIESTDTTQMQEMPRVLSTEDVQRITQSVQKALQDVKDAVNTSDDLVVDLSKYRLEVSALRTQTLDLEINGLINVFTKEQELSDARQALRQAALEERHFDATIRAYQDKTDELRETKMANILQRMCDQIWRMQALVSDDRAKQELRSVFGQYSRVSGASLEQGRDD